MKIFPRKSVLGFLFFLFIICAGCSANPANPNKNSNASANDGGNGNLNNANGVKDNLEELKQIIKLPFEPEEIVWREDSGENNLSGKRKLTAVMRFVPEDAGKIAAQAAAIKAGTPTVIETENWYPAELIAQSQISGDESVKGIAFPANDFFVPPFVNGTLTRVENSDYFILELTD